MITIFYHSQKFLKLVETSSAGSDFFRFLAKFVRFSA